MSYQRERDEFIARMAQEGLDLDIARRLLRAATTLQRYAELACSSEAADRDRVPCPASRKHGKPEDCCCDQYEGGHESVPRIAVLDQQLSRRVALMMPVRWTATMQGDPRGYVLRVIPPSYAERNQWKDRHNLDSIGVPSGPTRLRF